MTALTVGQHVRVLAQPLDPDDAPVGTRAVVIDPDGPYGIEVRLPRGTATYYREELQEEA